MSQFDWERGTYTCGRTTCPCLHNDPCDRGWIVVADGVKPCEACKPEVAIIFNSARSNYERNARLIARGGRRD